MQDAYHDPEPPPGSHSIRVAVLPGDGIGPEVTRAATRVLGAVADRFGHDLELVERSVGWQGVCEAGDPLPADTLATCLEVPAVLLGAVGHPAADSVPPPRRPEAGLLRLRQELGCFANLRPVRVLDAVVGASALRPELARGTDLLIVRELAGGLYYGEPRGETEFEAWNTLRYSVQEVDRIAGVAFDAAAARRGRVTSVDKANVLEASRLWRRTVDRLAAERDHVICEHMLIDRAAMELVSAPRKFDVMLTSNLFGDILSDAAAAVVGSLGLMGSASLGGTTDLYEPVHGSAPDLAGRDSANPTGAIASVEMMLDHTFGLRKEAQIVGEAVDAVLRDGIRTADLCDTDRGPSTTTEMADAVVGAIRASTPAFDARTR